MNLEDMMKEINAGIRRGALTKMLSLGDVIDALRDIEDKGKPIRMDFSYDGPGKLNSYRGYYDHLALTGLEAGRKVSDVLNDAEAAVGKTYSGYKGGDYRMDRDTPMWFASSQGDCHDTAVVAISDEGHCVVIHTAYVDL